MSRPAEIQAPLAYLVRPARIADIPAIQATARASWRAAYRKILSGQRIAGYLASSYSARALRAALFHRRSTFLVAVRRGKVLGLCHFGERGHGAEVFQLYVHPDYWGRGIGRRLLSHAEMQFLVTGARDYVLTVHRDNVRAFLFYAEQGFERDRERDRGEERCLRKGLPARP